MGREKKDREYCAAVDPNWTRPGACCVLGKGHAANVQHKDMDGKRWPVEFGGDAELEVSAYTPQNLTALARLLSPYRCCGAPQLCGVGCQDSPLADALATACREVEAALQQHGELCATTYGQPCDHMPGCTNRDELAPPDLPAVITDPTLRPKSIPEF